MPNAKVLGPPNAGAFKERKSGKYFSVLGKFPIIWNMIFDQGWTFWQKIESLTKNGIFFQKSKFRRKWNFWRKIEIWTKTRNFDEKWRFWPKIDILDENRNVGENWNFWPKFGQNCEFSPTFRFSLKVLVKIEIFGPNFDFWSKFEFLVKVSILAQNLNFDQNLKVWLKIEILSENRNERQFLIIRF